MEIRISHLRSRLSKACLLSALVMALSSMDVLCQAIPKGTKQNRHSSTQINEWRDDVAGAIHFLHELFPDINPVSKSIMLNNLNWKSSPGGTSAFTMYVCQPDLPTPHTDLHPNSFSGHDIQCSVLTMHATFFMSHSQLGPVPRSIAIGRPDLDKRWSELSALLSAHPEWSEVQMDQAMKDSGVKYPAASRSEVSLPIHKALDTLEPFLGKLAIDSMDYSPPILTDKSQPDPPLWVVKVHALGQDRTRSWTRYVLVFSAFDGALQSETTFDELGSSSFPKQSKSGPGF